MYFLNYFRDEPVGTIEGQQELLQIAEDMEPDKQKAIFELVQQVEDTHGTNDRVNYSRRFFEYSL